MHMWSTHNDSWGKSSGWGELAMPSVGDRNGGGWVKPKRDANWSSDAREVQGYLPDHFDPISGLPSTVPPSLTVTC